MTKKEGPGSADKMNRPMWYVKVLLLAAYYYVLDQAFGGLSGSREFRLYSFLIVSPVIKYLFLFKGKSQALTWRKKKEFVLSLIGDTMQVLLMHKVILVYCVGNYFFLYPFVHAISILAEEVLGYFMLDWRQPNDPEANDRFTIRMSKNPMDYMTMTCVSVVNYWAGTSIEEFGQPVTAGNLLALGFCIVLGDVAFGTTHYALHRIPKFWKWHHTHHQYKKEELNSFANFYSDLPDGMAMNSGILLTAIFMHLFKGPFAHEIIQIEYLFAALNSHSKYPTTFCLYLWFYEMDLLDVMFDWMRASEFHHHHHLESSEHFSGYGMIPDARIKGMMDPLLSMLNVKLVK